MFLVSKCKREGKTYLGLSQQPELEMMKEGLAGVWHNFMTIAMSFHDALGLATWRFSPY